MFTARLAIGAANTALSVSAVGRGLQPPPAAEAEASALRAVRRLATALIILGTLGVSACATPAAQSAPPQAPPVTAAHAVERDITEWNEFTGRLEAVHRVDVRPRVSGLISKVHFTEGAIVRPGDPLFEIDARPFQADVDRLRADLLRARAALTRATSERERAVRLTAENAMSAEEHDRRVSSADEAAAQVASVEAALRAAQLNLEFTSVVAPIGGRVGHAIVTEGNLVSSGPGEATLLTTLVSLDPIYASFEVDEQSYLAFSRGPAAADPEGSALRSRPAEGSALRNRPAGGQPGRQPGRRADPSGSALGSAGSTVHMALAGEDDFPHRGRLDFLDNQLDAGTGTIRVRAVFANPDGALTPGLFVRLRMAGSRSYRGVVVQDQAVGTDLDKRFVYVVGADQAVAYRSVTLGPLVDGLRVIRSGVQPAELVVVNGLQRVRPGVKVAPTVEPMERAQ